VTHLRYRTTQFVRFEQKYLGALLRVPLAGPRATIDGARLTKTRFVSRHLEVSRSGSGRPRQGPPRHRVMIGDGRWEMAVVGCCLARARIVACPPTCPIQHHERDHNGSSNRHHECVGTQSQHVRGGEHHRAGGVLRHGGARAGRGPRRGLVEPDARLAGGPRRRVGPLVPRHAAPRAGHQGLVPQGRSLWSRYQQGRIGAHVRRDAPARPFISRNALWLSRLIELDWIALHWIGLDIYSPEALGIVPATVYLMAAISLKWFFIGSVCSIVSLR